MLINDIHINIGVTGVCGNIWLNGEIFVISSTTPFVSLLVRFFLQLASHLLPNLLPPNSPYNLNTCSTAL